MIRPALVLSPAEARTVLARPRSPPGMSATRAITRVFTSAENAAPALTWWSVLALSPLSLPGETEMATNSSPISAPERSEEHTSELQSRQYLVCRLLLEKKKKRTTTAHRVDSRQPLPP